MTNRKSQSARKCPPTHPPTFSSTLTLTHPTTLFSLRFGSKCVRDDDCPFKHVTEVSGWGGWVDG